MNQVLNHRHVAFFEIFKGNFWLQGSLQYVKVRNYRRPCLPTRSGRNNRKEGTASLRSRMCVKRNAVFGARFEGLSVYFPYQKGNLIRIKMGLDTFLIHIQTRTPLSRYPLCDYSEVVLQIL